MKSFSVYILYSKSIDRYYIGYTGSIESRLAQHNKHVFKGSFTDKAVIGNYNCTTFGK